MKTETTYHYQKVAEAIAYLDEHFKEQPSLDQIAEQVHLSPFHFQRLFKEWVGISPKKYLQYLSASYAKQLLKEKGNTLFDAALDTGFSASSRLHDLFVNIEGMTPGEYKNGGKNLTIHYSFGLSPFGEVLVASTEKGICSLAFINNKEEGLEALQKEFPAANFQEKVQNIHTKALAFFDETAERKEPLKLHLKGSDFQLKVWEALLKIPGGDLQSYGHIAQHIGHPKASRAVGTAIGSNPVAYLIPCHRVIQSSGKMGGYRWHPNRKKAIIGWEIAKADQ
jgi:AraC family transcriptional regulator of adaptative response/methylated-DNA-[protein]-cysteine methyltransferase